MSQDDEKSQLPGDVNDAPDECAGVLSDDATAVTCNQHAGGLGEPSGKVSDVGPDDHVDIPEHSGPPAATMPGAVPSTGGAAEMSGASSFQQLVKSWETYITEAQNVDTFQPMQMLQSLRFCGTGQEIPRLTLAPSTEFAYGAPGHDQAEPIILRHTHSTPLQYRPSFFAEYDSNGLPPPSQLDPTRRSSSTPSRGSAFQQFRATSAYGVYGRSGSHLSGSAFGFPLQRSMYSTVSEESDIRGSAFNLVPSSLSTTQEETPQEETTEIEVMDLGRPEADVANGNGEAESEEVEVQLSRKDEPEPDQVKPKKSAAARAARFLSDVGMLRRKKKGARSSIMTAISSDKGIFGGKKTNGADKSNDGGLDGTQDKAISLDRSARSECLPTSCSKVEGLDRPSVSMYHQLDSDVDEEYDRYQSIENSGGESEDSPRTVPSPDYHPIVDDRPPSVTNEPSESKNENRRPAVRIQVSSSVSIMPTLSERIGQDTDSPVAHDDASATPTSSTGSPGAATRSSTTTYTSGHTTQATSTTSTTGNGSSQLSETDREVMETIKEGNRRRRQESQPENSKIDSDAAVTIDSSSSVSSTANGYVPLSGSPGPLRDGASVVADRFFKNSQTMQPEEPACSSSSSTSAVVGAAAIGVSSLSRKSTGNGSPTSCSLNSIEEVPPTFVSYLDRQDASDLTSLREANEASSRGDTEEREDSPAQIVGYPAMLLGERKEATEGQENSMSVFPKLVLPSAEHLYSMLEKFRSRPPRSPAKGLRTLTPTPPPPRLGSPVYQHHQLSPPRKIIDHRMETNVSKPYVVRTNPTTQRVVLVSPGSYVRPTTPLLCIPVGSPNYSPNQNRSPAALPERRPSPYGDRTYEEHSIEILKKDSKDEMISQRFSSPETVASASASVK